MKKKTLLATLLLVFSIGLQAQDDPTIMTINGVPVTRSEFEYSYNKNNNETIADKKTVDEYVELFVNYKLKVAAALEAGIDSTQAFNKEFLMYRDQQLRPSFITDDDVERETRKIYAETKHHIDSCGGLVNPSHILVLLKQKASQEEQEKAKARIDSIYTALQGGADFAELAKTCSDDKKSGARGGVLGWIQKGQTLREFEDVVFNMQPGEVSKPFSSTVGYHIVKLQDKSLFFPYDSVREDIRSFIDQRGIRERIISQNIDSIAKASVPRCSPKDVMDKRSEEMQAKDPELKNLIREYHDGLLLYEISNRNVWDKAAKDTQGLEQFFKKNKKKYKWGQPRYKGIAYHTKKAEDVERVKASVKDIPFNDWGETLRKTFNDSTVTVRVVKGVFKPGDNALIDKEVFKKDTTEQTIKDFPFAAIYGTVIKAPKTYEDVRELVVSDYQESLEKKWVADLRKRYVVDINKDVLATVNKH